MAKQKLDQNFERYLNAVSRRGRSHLTVTQYQSHLRPFQAWCDEQGIDPMTIKPVEFEDFLFSQINAGLQNITIDSRIKAIRWAFNYLVKMELIEKNPTLNVETPKVAYEEPEILTNDELRAILEACQDDREYLIFHLLAYTGLRRSEMLHLTWDCVDWDSREFKVMGKGQKFRRVPIADALWEVLTEAYSRREDDTWIIGTNRGNNMSTSMFYAIWKGVLDRANVEMKQMAHGFRKTVATNLYEQGVREDVIDAIMGWAKQGIRQRYYTRLPDELMHQAINLLYTNDPLTTSNKELSNVR